MLVLSRKPEQGLQIGDDIELIVLEVRGGVVRLGIRAPERVRVFRSELVESVRLQNEEAVRSTPKDPAELEGLLSEFRTPPT